MIRAVPTPYLWCSKFPTKLVPIIYQNFHWWGPEKPSDHIIRLVCSMNPCSLPTIKTLGTALLGLYIRHATAVDVQTWISIISISSNISEILFFIIIFLMSDVCFANISNIGYFLACAGSLGGAWESLSRLDISTILLGGLFRWRALYCYAIDVPTRIH